MAGFRELLAVEWDPVQVATFSANFPEVPVYPGDIAQLTAAECLRLAGLTPGALDVLDGSPPCQGFSTAGKRRLADDRNQLFHEFTRLLSGLQPRAFVMENVSGLIKGKMRLIFVEILRALKSCGYRVSARLLNAMYFGVPQSRQRLVFVGVRNDLVGEPSHPRPLTLPITVRQALAEPLAPSDARPLSPSMRAAVQRMRPGNYSGSNAERAFRATRGSTAGAMNTKLLAWDRVCCTLPRSVIAETGIVHPARERYLSTAEAKRIGSFPDDFVLTGPYQDKWASVGNSVPPLLMKAIAEHVSREFLTGREAVHG
jgi:DNA (cytosine-5)-methyltransferase 1